MYNILVVDDDKEIVESIEIFLRNEGFNIYKAYNGLEALDVLVNKDVHLILMDIMMPKLDGIKATIKIREEKNIPIILVSAKSEDTDKIMGLNIGADDYITKPFYYDVVMAKIKSHIRRVYGEYSPKIDERIVELDGLKFYPERLELELNGENLIITKKEGILIECLIKRYPKVVSRDYLLEKIWDDIEFVEENTLNVNVSRIRKRFEELGIDNAVQTVRGLGYKLNKNW